MFTVKDLRFGVQGSWLSVDFVLIRREKRMEMMMRAEDDDGDVGILHSRLANPSF